MSAGGMASPPGKGQNAFGDSGMGPGTIEPNTGREISQRADQAIRAANLKEDTGFTCKIHVVVRTETLIHTATLPELTNEYRDAINEVRAALPGHLQARILTYAIDIPQLIGHRQRDPKPPIKVTVEIAPNIADAARMLQGAIRQKTHTMGASSVLENQMYSACGEYLEYNEVSA